MSQVLGGEFFVLDPSGDLLIEFIEAAPERGVGWAKCWQYRCYLTVDENIRFYADLFGVNKRERDERAPQLLRAAGMFEFRARLAGKLSGGMKQKLGLVCALIHRPKAILLDEPTNGVDPVSRRDFWRILYDLIGEGVAILTSTAYLDEAERCHRVALLRQGRLSFLRHTQQPQIQARQRRSLRYLGGSKPAA
jgi:ABC-type multidrug transport system ATPase subunit